MFGAWHAIVVATNAASGSSAAKLANSNDEAASCSAAKPVSSKDHHIPEVLRPLLTALNTTVGKYREEAEAWDPSDVYDLEDTKATERDKPRFLLKMFFATMLQRALHTVSQTKLMWYTK